MDDIAPVKSKTQDPDDIAPIREDIAKNATTTEGTVSKTGHVDDIAPIADAEATANITSKKLSFREEFGEVV